MPNLVRSRIETGGSVTVSNKSGTLRRIVVTDTSTGAGAWDATISINIDGLGAEVISITNFQVENLHANQAGEWVDDPAAAGADGVFVFSTPMSFRSSLSITISNADGSIVVWDEDVF